MNRPVIVGHDGSAVASSALRYAAEEARRRGSPLHILHAFGWPVIFPPFHAPYDEDDRGPRAAMLDLLAGAVRDVRADYPDVPVTRRMIDGSPGGVLVDASRDAQLIVVGHRGTGGFAGLLIGSVGIQVSGHAHCPVVVVRGDATPADAPAVLGVDGSAQSFAAAEVAFAQARRQGVELVVAYHWPGRTPPGDVAVPHSLNDIVTGVHDVGSRYVDVNYRIENAAGASAAAALIDIARRTRAGLLIVGSRGHGGFRTMVLGSTSRTLIEHAPCPVMVIPADRDDDADATMKPPRR